MKKGFTLIELLVVVALIGIIISAVTKYEFDIISFNRNLNSSLTVEQEAQSAIKVMTKEIKSMQPSANGAYPIANASGTALTFYFDTTGDGIPDQISYYLSTSNPPTLIKKLVAATGTPVAYTGSAVYTQLAHNVKNASATPIFTFYDSNYPVSTTSLASPIDLQQVRLVKINLILDTDPNKSPTPMTYTTQISIRSLKTNL